MRQITEKVPSWKYFPGELFLEFASFQDWEKLRPLSERLASLGIMDALRALKPLQ